MTTNHSLSKALLYTLFQTTRGIINTILIPNDLVRWHKTLMQGGWERVKQLKQLQYKSKFKTSYYNLKRGQYISVKKTGDKLILSLTNKGAQLILKNQIRQAPNMKSNLYTLIVFDVPESQRRARNQLRLFLKDLNFKQLQKSVWVSRQAVYDELSHFIKQLKIEDWVNIALVKNLLNPPK